MPPFDIWPHIARHADRKQQKKLNGVKEPKKLKGMIKLLKQKLQELRRQLEMQH